jgi:hypothetical protein
MYSLVPRANILYSVHDSTIGYFIYGFCYRKYRTVLYYTVLYYILYTQWWAKLQL